MKSIKLFLIFTFFLTSQIYAQDNWTPLNSGTTKTINSITFFNADTGIVVGDAGTILRTFNGGIDWTLIEGDTGTTNTSYSPNEIFAESFNSSRSNLSQGVGIVVGNGGTIKRSEDLGLSWTTIPSNTSQNINGITNDGANYPAEFIYAVGDSGLILKSSDDGLTWTQQVSGTAVKMNSVTFFNVDTGVAVGNNGTILRTTDGGTLWSAISGGLISTALSPNEIFAESFNSSRSNLSQGVGVVVGNGGTILRSTDFGLTWSPVSSGTSSSLWGLAFKDSSLTAVGDSGIVLVSSDLGKNWQRETSRTTAQLRAVEIAIKEEGVNRYAGGGGGALLKAAPSQLSITSPSTGDIWYTGTSHTIIWTGGNPAWNVLISLVDVNAWAVYTVINSNTLNDGSEVWNFPATIPPGPYQIYIQEVNQVDWKYSGTFTIAKQDTSCITPPDSMVAWWSLDETTGTIADDIAGFNNMGTYVGNPTPVPGKVAGALSFNASTDYIEVADHPELNFGTGNFSIDAWVRTTQTDRATIIDKRTGTNTNPVGYTLFISGGKLGFQIGDGSPFLNHNSPNPAINDGNWHHVAVTINRTSATGGSLYIDGALNLTFDPTTHQGNISNTANLWIGQHQISSVQTYQAFQGEIDEIEIFNRVLTAGEVNSIWAADSTGKCKSDTLGTFGGIKFNDLNGNGVQDSTETGIPDWTITLSGTVTDSTLTDSLGNYSFNNLAPGSYTIAEVQQSGWTPTTPGSQTVTLGAGQTVTVSFGNQQSDCVPPPPGMVSWWDGDAVSGNTAFDIQGTNNGTLVNGVTIVPGKVGNAFSFDGVDGIVTTPLINDYTNGITFDAWVKTTSNDITDVIIINGGGINSDETGMGITLFQGKPVLTSNIGVHGVTNFSIVSSTLINDGIFHHVAGTWTGDTAVDGANFYVDGVLVGTATALASITTSSNATEIGGYAPTIGPGVGLSDYYLAGIIDEVEIFNRVLSATEIQAIFLADSLGKCKLPVSVDEDHTGQVPQEFLLEQNYPNPFNPSTKIKYQLPELSFVTIKIYDVLGSEVTTLVNEEKPAGSYEVKFDATGLPSGTYFYSLKAGEFNQTKKMILLK